MANSILNAVRGRVGAFVAASLLATALVSCTSVGPVSNPASYIASKQPRTVWLTRTNKSVVKVDGPRMLGDTVIGSVGGDYTEIPLTDVTRVAAVEPAKGKTIAAAALGGVVTAAALVVIFSHGGSSNNGGIDTQQDTMTLGRQTGGGGSHTPIAAAHATRWFETHPGQRGVNR